SENQKYIDDIYNKMKPSNFVAAVFLSLTDRFVNEFYDFFAGLSRKFGVYTITCNNQARFRRGHNTWEPSGREVYNTAFVFNPKGELIFEQDKVYLTKMETDLGISGGDLSNVTPFSVEGKKIGIAISLDAFTPPYISRLEGAEIIIQPDANPEKWNSILSNGRWQPEEWMDSAYYIAQRMGGVKFVINPMMVGDLMEIRFEGQSSITKKADLGDDYLSYLGNLPTAGFHTILEVAGYSAKEPIDRKEIIGEKLEFQEGVIELEA
ncbi:MAG: carbon-nitrogen hydrolase family protein, partial [Nitrososphaerota archaeon]